MANSVEGGVAEGNGGVTAQPVKQRLWLERLGVALITVVALGAPFLFGFVFYLGLQPQGITFNDNDPFRQGHIWMQRERRGVTGIGIQTTRPEAGPNNLQCARTSLTYLHWRPNIGIDTNGGSCTCYEMQQGRPVISSAVCE